MDVLQPASRWKGCVAMQVFLAVTLESFDGMAMCKLADFSVAASMST